MGSRLENSRLQLDGDGVYGKEVKSEGLRTPRVGSRPSTRDTGESGAGQLGLRLQQQLRADVCSLDLHPSLGRNALPLPGSSESTQLIPFQQMVTMKLILYEHFIVSYKDAHPATHRDES